MCPACRLFGWVFGRPGVEEGELPISAAGAYRGRLKVSHAECVEEHPWGETPIPLAILSTPKPTTSRFYLVDGNGKPIAGQEDSVSGYDGDVAGTPNRLRGRKIYRRHTEVTAQEYQRAGQRRDDQNRTIRGVVGPDSRFTFRIHFENLAKEELGGLLWSIELEKNWCHRLGMARPLGFGSVQVCVTELLHFDPNARYQANLEQTGVNSILGHKGDLVEAFKKRIVTLYAQQPAQQPSHRHGATLQDQLAHLYKPSFESLPPVQDLKALLGPEQPQLPVHYPRSEVAPTEDGKNFEWFMGNKRSGKDSGPRLALPLAPDDTQGFPLLNKQGNTP
ncbi:MAG: CRISPR-associated RAMP family protein [Syntrophobacteraceae bacterium CG2_30_61_12]|nr:MAG: CRISPR-associated RAMP family protein [Syntrophobacteraceae bacterium CG2_30_61_12]